MKFQYNDGGRAAAGYKGEADDCVCRAIAIATGKPYQEVYDALFEASKVFAAGRSRVARNISRTGASPRNGQYRQVYDSYLKELGWKFIPTMSFGSGCTVHLCNEELPDKGVLIVRLSGHLCTIVDGVINDTSNPQRFERREQICCGVKQIVSRPTRCVYGYYVNT